MKAHIHSYSDCNLSKKDCAVVFSLTSDLTFAVASVMMDLKNCSPNLADEIVIFHDGIKNHDKSNLATILPVRFIRYNPPFGDLSIFDKRMIRRFTPMVFAKFECLRLLQQYRTVIFLDYDIVVQSNLQDLLEPGTNGWKVVPSETTVRDNLYAPIGGYDMAAKSTCASLFVLHDSIENPFELCEWCYKTAEDYAEYLYLPEQAVFDLLFQYKGITPDRSLNPLEYNCHPGETEALKSAKIVHSYGGRKFWDFWESEQWNKNYKMWIEIGGSRYNPSSNKAKKTFFARFLCRFGSAVTKVRGLFELLTTWKLTRRYDLLLRYFKSPQYKSTKWTFRQAKSYSEDFRSFLYNVDFSMTLSNQLAGLDEESRNRMIFLIHRMMYLSFLNRREVFSEDENWAFSREKRIRKAIRNHEGLYEISGFRFLRANMAIHNFVDDLGINNLPLHLQMIGGDVIDVGAYVGDSSLILSRHCEGTVFAFEPLPEVYVELKENLRLNNTRRIEPLNIALADAVGRKELHYSDDGNLSIATTDPERTLSKGAYTRTAEVEVSTIDNFVMQRHLTIGLIKIDAEGAEQEVLRGGAATIRRDKPILLVSIYHNIDDFFKIKPWIDSLDLGYQYKVTKPTGSTFIEESMLVCFVDE